MLPDPNLTEPQSVRKEHCLAVFLKRDCPRFLAAVYRLKKKAQIHFPLTHFDLKLQNVYRQAPKPLRSPY
jgi:hypothetical protein